jgi:adenine-specific DNA-methyltransferase
MNTTSSVKPTGFKDRLDYNADFALDWTDRNEASDGYQLKWLGKNYARFQSGTAPVTVIIPDTEHNAKPENAESGNIFLTGDNLEVLKHLQNAYAGSIDMIYIDPPYNTGKKFVYSDSFDFSDDKLRDMLGMTEEEIKRLHTINGRNSHSAWLTFMYPRLKLARKLLKDTGVIFISIDDNEQANLKLLCDEIFGEGNFVCDFIWQT